MCICVYVYMYICVYVYMYICVCACCYEDMYVLKYVSLYSHTHVTYYISFHLMLLNFSIFQCLHYSSCTNKTGDEWGDSGGILVDILNGTQRIVNISAVALVFKVLCCAVAAFND